MAAAAIPLKNAEIAKPPDGTAEGICRTAREVQKGVVIIKATGVFVEGDEFDSIAAEMARPQSKLDAFTRKIWMGIEAGSNASDEKRKAPMPEHSTRVCFLYGAQPARLGPLLEKSDVGSPQRFDFAMVGTVRKAERGPRYGTQPPMPFLINQDKLPWFNPTGLPPGYAPKNSPTIDGQPDSPEPETKGLPGYDDTDPVWIGIPDDVRQAIEEADDIAAARSEDWNLARRQDEEGTSGHNILLQEKIAFGFAVWDGEANISKAHWEAAGLYLEMRQLVYAAAAAEVEIARRKSHQNEGKDRGIQQAAAKATAATIMRGTLQRTCDRIVKIADAAAGAGTATDLAAKVMKAQKAGKKQGRVFTADGAIDTVYLVLWLSTPQKDYMDEALAHLKRKGYISGDDRFIRRAPIHAAPPAGSAAS